MYLKNTKPLICLALWIPLALSSPSLSRRRTVNQNVYDDLVLYTKYASAIGISSDYCPKPLNSTLITQVVNNFTQTQGMITRDDVRREIILGFAGSQQLLDVVTDLDLILVPFVSKGIRGDAYVHQGFLNAYNSVVSEILATVASQLAKHPSYSLVSVGHSLGGALASIAGISLKANFPHVPLRMFTFGQPRTGNAEYAALAESLIGAGNIFRSVHTYDGIPTAIPQALGYRHHATEYWNFQEPSAPENVKVCSGGEDPTCSDSIPSTGINDAHARYYGIAMGQDPSLCGL